MKKLTISTLALAATLALSSCGDSESQKKAEQKKIPKTEQTSKPQEETKNEVKKIIEVDKDRDNLLNTLKSVGLYNKEMQAVMSMFDEIKKDPESLRPQNFKKDIYTSEPNISLPDVFIEIDKKDMLVLFIKHKETLMPLFNLLSPAGKRVALEWVAEYEALANHKLSRAKLDLIKSSIKKSVKKRKQEGYASRHIHAQGASLISSYTNGRVSVFDARAYLFQRGYGDLNISELLEEVKSTLEK